MVLCRKLIPTLTLLSALSAPSLTFAAEAAAGPPSDEPRPSLAAALRALGDQVAGLWTALTDGAPTSPAGGSPIDPEGQGGHDPNGVGTLPTGGEEPPAS